MYELSKVYFWSTALAATHRLGISSFFCWGPRPLQWTTQTWITHAYTSWKPNFVHLHCYTKFLSTWLHQSSLSSWRATQVVWCFYAFFSFPCPSFAGAETQFLFCWGLVIFDRIMGMILVFWPVPCAPISQVEGCQVFFPSSSRSLLCIASMDRQVQCNIAAV
jgi:hypothetical protein